MWIYIILGLLGLFAVLLLSPVVLQAGYDGTFRVTVRFWCFRFRVLPNPTKKKKKPRKQAKPAGPPKKKAARSEAKEGAFDRLVERYGVTGAVGLLLRTAAALPKILLRLLKGARVRHMELQLGITGADAADAAIHYGEVCSILYPFLGAASHHMKFIRPRVNVYCDYQGDKPFLQGKAGLYISLYHIVGTAFFALKELILKNKGGQNNERTKSESHDQK